MARLAIITDVHADIHALNDALVQIERLGCDEIVCAGDILDWGLFPEETIRVLRERRVATTQGNHDRWAVSEGRDASGWDLTPGAVAFLEGLPVSWTRGIDGVRVAVWHARVRSDMKGIYPDASATELASQLDRAEADVLVVGHTHLPFARFVDRRLVCNPGALLRDPAQPMESNGMLFDPASGKFVPGPASGGGTFGILELPTLRVHRSPGARWLGGSRYQDEASRCPSRSGVSGLHPSGRRQAWRDDVRAGKAFNDSLGCVAMRPVPAERWATLAEAQPLHTGRATTCSRAPARTAHGMPCTKRRPSRDDADPALSWT